MHTIRYVQRQRPTSSIDLHTAFCTLYISARGLSTTRTHRATGGANNATPNPQHSATPEANKRSDVPPKNKLGKPPNALPENPTEKTAVAREKSKALSSTGRAAAQEPPKLGGLAPNSIFAGDLGTVKTTGKGRRSSRVSTLSLRSPQQMAARLDPRPSERRGWQRRMIAREIRRSHRPTRAMILARTERTHTAKSQFFKTSVKKLAPLARQIADKSLDEAILQMRFSSKKAAAEVKKHLIQARNEAIVMRGMGIPTLEAKKAGKSTTPASKLPIQERIMEAFKKTEPSTATTSTDTVKIAQSVGLTQSSAVSDRSGPEITSPAETAPLPTQNPTKSVREGIESNPTDIYIAQAWVNRGQYGMAANHRARGRIDRLRLPYTGISVMLKEEKTRTREKAEKEVKAINKRLNGKVWTQLPDRPIVRQSQHVLW